MCGSFLVALLATCLLKLAFSPAQSLSLLSSLSFPRQPLVFEVLAGSTPAFNISIIINLSKQVDKKIRQIPEEELILKKQGKSCEIVSVNNELYFLRSIATNRLFSPLKDYEQILELYNDLEEQSSDEDDIDS